MVTSTFPHAEEENLREHVICYPINWIIISDEISPNSDSTVISNFDEVLCNNISDSSSKE